MKVIKVILSSFLLCFIVNFAHAQNNYSAKKLYREFNKYEQFKQAQIPKYLLAAARFFIKNDEVSSILKAVQKSKVLSVNNPKFSSTTNDIFSEFSSKLDKTKYKAMDSKSKNLKIFTREKKGKVKEIAILNRTGPTLHYILMKGNLRKDESDKFLSQLNKLGVNVDGLAEKLMNELEKILKPQGGNTSQPKTL